MRELVDAADDWLGLRRMELTVYTDKGRAIRLYQRFGFETEGTPIGSNGSSGKTHHPKQDERRRRVLPALLLLPASVNGIDEVCPDHILACHRRTPATSKKWAAVASSPSSGGATPPVAQGERVAKAPYR
ncbi:hypothetical protein [Microvirga sp. VF16]|uniref:hypothetical protein n=1 Tax=Microvirga sp. VF16 TaxID=2807101 RepID=UPI001FF00404|nr:hypothetical protein [Microvirga sp. VF16]